MLIKSITLNNFKSYYGENIIPFSKGLNVVSGRIGTGKTSLFDAFAWILNEFILDASEKFDTSIINGKYLAENNDGEGYVTSVSLCLEGHPNSDGILIDYEFTKQIFFKIIDGKAINTSKELFYAFEDPLSRDYFKESNRSSFIDKLQEIIRPGLLDYILFKGENVEQLISFDQESTLKTAVDRISYYRYYVKLKEHIIDFEKLSDQKLTTRTKERYKNNKALTEANSLIKVNTDKIEAKEKKVKELNILIKDFTDAKEDIYTQLELIKGIPEIRMELKGYETERKTAFDKRETLQKYGKKRIIDSWIYINANPLLTRYQEEKEKFENQRHKTLKAVNKQLTIGVPGDKLIDQMIDQCKCLICGTEFEKGGQEEKTILSHKDKNKAITGLSPENDRIFAIFNSLHSTIALKQNDVRDVGNSIKQYRKDSLVQVESIRELLDKIKKTKEKEAQLFKSKNLAPSQLSSLSRVREKGKTIDHQLKTAEAERRALNRDLSELESQLSSARTQRKKYINAQDDKVLNEEVLCSLSSTLKTIINQLVDEERVNILKRIEEETNSIINGIIQSAKTINNIITVKVKIDANTCQISFTDKQGTDVVPHGAQSKLAKLAVISAILKMTSTYLNEDYTFIVDAPSSEFDETIFEPYLKSNHENFSQSIVILKDIHKDLAKYKKADYINNIIMLDKNKTKGEATVETSHTEVTIL